MKINLVPIITLALTLALLFMGVKGQSGNPIYFQTEKNTMVGGPFESSNSTSRYALVEAIVEYRSLTLTEDQAQFAAPDLASSNGKLFSIFTPGVSFVAVPFYMLGKLFGMQQLFTYLSTIIFALLNVLLITLLGKKLGAHMLESTIGGLIFLFGTNALAYAFSLTQHHMSTMLILLALHNALSPRTWINNLLLGLIYGAGLLADVPNAIMMLPIILYVLAKHISITSHVKSYTVSVSLNSLFMAVGLCVLVAVFGWYNVQTTGSPTALAQAVGRADFTNEGVVERTQESRAASIYDHGGVYDTRPQLQGLYILLLSDERGVLYYSPVLLIGILGLIKAYEQKRNRALIVMASSIALVCFVTYASFGDPWGGWSFGARYLIPASALMSIGVGAAIHSLKRNPLFIVVLFILLAYSIFINALGALTTSAIPPKVEAINLPEPLPFTYRYNWQFIEKSFTSSLVYNLSLYHYVSVKNYLFSFAGLILSVISALFIGSFWLKNKSS